MIAHVFFFFFGKKESNTVSQANRPVSQLAGGIEGKKLLHIVVGLSDYIYVCRPTNKRSTLDQSWAEEGYMSFSLPLTNPYMGHAHPHKHDEHQSDFFFTFGIFPRVRIELVNYGKRI